MKFRRITVAVVAAFATLVPANAARGYISGNTGAVTIIPPPACVDRLVCGLESSTTAWAWNERQGVTLAAPTKVDINAVGSYESGASLTGGTLATGTVV